MTAVAAPPHGSDHRENVNVGDLLHVPLAALGHEVEHDEIATDGDVFLADGGQTERAVLARIGLGPHAEERVIEQTNGARQRARLRNSSERQVSRDAFAQDGEPMGELDHALELLLVAANAPVRVIQVLPPPGTIHTHGLDVPERIGTDSHVLPGGRDDERTDTLERRGIDHGPAWADVREPSPATASRNRRTVDGRPSERHLSIASAATVPFKSPRTNTQRA